MSFITKAVEQLQSYLPKSEPLRAITTTAAIGASLFAVAKVGLAVKGAIARAKRAAAAKKRRAEQKKDVVYLFGFPQSKKDGTQLSCPVERVECYLKLKSIPYVFVPTMDNSLSDTERFPFIELNGVQYTDSKFILDELEAHFNKADPVAANAELERENTATSTALLALQDSARLHHYRTTMVEYPDYTIKLFVEYTGYPEFMVRRFIMNSRKGQISMLNSHGQGDLNFQMYNINFLEDIKALEYFVGKNGGASKFILGGDVPTKIDCLIAPWIKNFRRPEALSGNIPAFAFVCASPVFKEYLELFEAAVAKATPAAAVSN